MKLSLIKIMIHINFIDLKNELGDDIVKTYFSSRDLRLHWIEAFMLCRTFDMDLVELPSATESDNFLRLCAQKNSDLNSDFFHIGASYAGLGVNEYYWMTTGNRINYALQWGPNQPDNVNGIENCLSIQKQTGSYKFNDMNMDTTSFKHKFICQRITNSCSNSFIDPDCTPVN